LFLYRANFFEVFVGDFLSLEAGFMLKKFFLTLGCNNFFFVDDFIGNADFRYFYLLNTTFTVLEQFVNVCFIGTNLRLEAPLLNVRLRKAFLATSYFKAYSLGCSINYMTYPVHNFGTTIKTYLKFLDGKLFLLRELFIFDYYNLAYAFGVNVNLHFFIGSAVFRRLDGFDLLSALLQFVTNARLSFSFLHIISLKMGRICASELALVTPLSIGWLKVRYDKLISSCIYLCGVDYSLLTMPFSQLFRVSYVIFQGSFANSEFKFLVDILLPVNVYTENSLSYLNLEGKLRQTNSAVRTS